MMQPMPPEPDVLLAHAAFVHAVARATIKDASLAEDVVQETWLAALRDGSKRRGPWRAWLSGVARRQGANLARKREAQRRRDVYGVRAGSEPCTDDVAARAEVGRLVVGAVLALDAPYRDPLLLRYFDELPPREIAERLGLPVETVRTRIKRGLGKLRDKLDESGADAKGWRALLLPLVGAPLAGDGAALAAGTLTGKIAGGLIMGKKGIVGLCLLVALLLVGVISSGALDGSGQESELPEDEVAEAEGPTLRGRGGAIAAHEPLRSEATSSGADRGVVMGRLEFPAGMEQRTARLEVQQGGRTVSLSDVSGSFEVDFDCGKGPLRVTLEAAGFRSRAWFLPTAGLDLGRIALVQSTGYGGWVVSTEGNPVAGVRVQMRRLGGRAVGRSLPTGADGRYRIDLSERPVLSTESDGTLRGYTLHTFRRDERGKAHRAHMDGWKLLHDIQFIPVAENRLRLVSGEEEGPVVGAMVLAGPAHAAYGLSRPARGYFRGMSDENGDLRLRLPNSARSLLLEVHVPGGEPLFVKLDPAEMNSPVHVVSLDHVLSTSAVVRWGRTSVPVAGAEVWIEGHIPRWLTPAEKKLPPFLRPKGTYFCAAGRTGVDGSVEFRFAAPGGGALPVFRVDHWAVTCMGDGPPRTESGRGAASDLTSGDSLPLIELEGSSGEAGRGAMWVRVTEGQSARSVVPLSGRLTVLRGAQEVASMPMWFSRTPFLGRSPVVLWRMGPSSSDIPDDLVASGAFSGAVFTLAAAGRAPRDIVIARDDLQSAWAGERVLVLSLPPMSDGFALHVRDSAGQPAARVFVALQPEGGVSYADWRLTTDEDGTVWLADLDSRARYTVSAYDPTRGSAVRVMGWQPRETTLALRAARSISVRAIYPGGKAAAGAQLDLWIRPTGVTRNIQVVAGSDGWIKLPPCVHTLCEFSITARDDEYGRAHDCRVGTTHERRIQGREVQDGQEIVLYPR